MNELWIGTSNKGKLAEFQSLLHNCNFNLKSQAELSTYFSPEETGKTFEENARIKAKSLRTVVSQHWVVAEDSGLVVEGLNDYPGIYSARYAGDNASDAENVAKVLKMLSIRSPQNRKAKMVSHIIAINSEGKEFSMEGIVEGKISKKLSGTDGFGYDVCFIPNGQEKTFAELGMAFKNQNSHRAKAIQKLKEIIV
jgi:XTP/dITP diphosphohydrolase